MRTSMQEQEAAEAADPRRWWMLGVLSLALFVIILNNGLLNVAIPEIMQELGTGISATQWIVDGYALVFAAALLTAGTLSDRYGRKRATLLGTCGFGVGSLLALTADGTVQLVAARCVMGLAAAFVMPGTLAILVDVFPARERPRAIAVWGSSSALGVAAGPVIGGLLVDRFWWGSIFLVNLPPVLVVLAAGLWLLPESSEKVPRPADPVGAVLGSATMTALVYGVIHAAGQGWTSAPVLVALTACGACAAGFVAWERRHPFPMVNFALLRTPAFLGASAGSMLLFLGLAGTLFVLTQQLQFALGYSPLEAGLAVAPLAVGVGLGSTLTTALTRLAGTDGGVACGLACAAAGMLTLSQFSDSYLPIVAGLLLSGFGIGLALTPVTDTVMTLVPPERSGNAAALNDTMQELGNALGVAVVGTVLARQYGTQAAGPPASREARQSFVEAASSGFLVAASVVAAGAAVAAALLPGSNPVGRHRLVPGSRTPGRHRRPRQRSIGPTAWSEEAAEPVPALPSLSDA